MGNRILFSSAEEMVITQILISRWNLSDHFDHYVLLSGCEKMAINAV